MNCNDSKSIKGHDAVLEEFLEFCAGRSGRELAEEFGITVDSLYDLKRRFRKGERAVSDGIANKLGFEKAWVKIEKEKK